MSVPVLPENWEVVTNKEMYDNCCANKLTNSTVSSVDHEVVVITAACKINIIHNLFSILKE